MNRDHSAIFEIVTRCYISDTFVDSKGYSISSKGFLPTVLDIIVTWIKFNYSGGILVHWFLKCQCSLLPSSVWPLPIYLDSWTYHSKFLWNIVLYSIKIYFHHKTHPQLGIVSTLAQPFYSFLSYLVFLELLLFSSSVLGIYWPGEFIFQCYIFLPFHTVHVVLNARMLKWFNIPFYSGLCFVSTLQSQTGLWVFQHLVEAQVSCGLPWGQGHLPQRSWKAQYVMWQT